VYNVVVGISPSGIPIPTGLAIDNLGGGNYTISYQDRLGCQVSASYEIINPDVRRRSRVVVSL